MQKNKESKLINLIDYKNKEKKEYKEFMLAKIDDLKKALEEDRILNFIVEWENYLPKPEEDIVEGYLVFWNEENNIDIAISKSARIQNRLIFIADGMSLDFNTE